MSSSITLNPDEFSQDPLTGIIKIKSLGLNDIEIRSAFNTNIADLGNDDIKKIKNIIKSEGVNCIAFASPLFKWFYEDEINSLIFDNYYFNPNINYEKKKDYISKCFDICSELNIKIIRVFSYITTSGNIEKLLNDKLFQYLIELSKSHDVNVAIENEPICTYNRLEQINIFKKENLLNEKIGLWFDISNFFYVKDAINSVNIDNNKGNIFYYQFKNFINEPEFEYVSLDKGIIDYNNIVGQLTMNKTNNFINIETHIKREKIEQIEKSVIYLRDTIKRWR